MSKETLWRRLLIWGALTVTTSAGAMLLMPNGAYVPGAALVAAISAIAGCAGFGASVYCFAIFILSRQTRYLLAAMAFSTLVGGAALQALVDLHTPAPASYSWIMTSSWLVSALLFVGEAHSHSRWRSSQRTYTVIQFLIAAIAVLAFPLAVLPYALDPSLLSSLGSTLSGAHIGHIVDSAINFAALGLLAFALIGHYRRYQSTNDHMAMLVCYFLTSCTLGLFFCAISTERFDQLHIASQLCTLWAWVMLMAGSGIENAFEHKDASERLKEFEALHDISWSLVGAGTVHELLDMFVRTLVDKLGARIATVYLSDSEGSLEVASICGSDESSVGKRYSLSPTGYGPGFHSGHTVKALVTKEVQVVCDVFVDVEFVPWRVIAADDGCAASIPLTDHENAIGVLNVYFSDRSQLTPSRLKLLTTVAAAATSAIEFALAKSRPELPDAEDDMQLAA